MTRVVTRTLRLAVVLLAVVSLGRRRAFIAFGLGITWLVTTVIRLDGRLGCLLFRSVLVYGLFLMRVFRALLGLGIVLLRMTTTVAGAAGAAALIATIRRLSASVVRQYPHACCFMWLLALLVHSLL